MPVGVFPLSDFNPASVGRSDSHRHESENTTCQK